MDFRRVSGATFAPQAVLTDTPMERYFCSRAGRSIFPNVPS